MDAYELAALLIPVHQYPKAIDLPELIATAKALAAEEPQGQAYRVEDGRQYHRTASPSAPAPSLPPVPDIDIDLDR